MKILTIRLKNLASIEGTFEVDFTVEPLRSAASNIVDFRSYGSREIYDIRCFVFSSL